MTPTDPRQFGHCDAARSTRSRSTRSRSTRSRRAGLTLIEVAVALVVFIIGALAVVQVFPPLLGEVQNSESRTVASRMNDSTLARLSDDPQSVPDAIYNDDGSGQFQSVASSVTGTATLNNALPDVASAQNESEFETSFSNSALAKFKRVVGERHQIVQGSPDFVLTRFPYEAATLQVYQEGDVHGVRIDSSGELDFSHAYLGSNPAVVFDPTSLSGGTYYVSYRWVEADGVHGVVDEPIQFFAGTSSNNNRVAVSFRSATQSVLPGPVAMRVRVLRTPSIAPTSDDAQRGYLPLDNYSLDSISDSVSLDYTVLDWRWLADDELLNQTPPPATDSSVLYSSGETRYVRLPLRNLETQAQRNGNAIRVFGLLRSLDGSAVQPNLLPLTDAEAGFVYYDSSGLTTPYARTVYQTIDNWTHQLAVAARSYIPYYSDASFADVASPPGPGHRPTDLSGSLELLPREKWREYVAFSPSEKLYFHPGEAGKTIEVAYNDSNNTTHNKIVTISPKIEPGSFYGIDADFYQGSGQVAVAELPSGATTVLSVRGLSIHARTAWITGDRWTQNALIGYRKQ